ncbi:DNA polymerase III subunit beta [Buchnera aphidicola (Mollitrichosiphum nigrofasciatum)]|uniref:DNA polymerase III subunit beta n=1 Tax=Buchnera aphidicola TaxID=9 RepID=UPI0031B81BDC
MKFTINQITLLKHLKIINNLLIKNRKYPILENILIEINNGELFLTSTNLDTEIITKTKKIYNIIDGKTTLSGRKLLNICRSINKNTNIKFILIKYKMHVFTENSKCIISTLPYENFPKINSKKNKINFCLIENELKYMIFKTQFSMGLADVRYYINGMLLEIKNNTLFIVTTDGFRLSLCSKKIKNVFKNHHIIIPRKSILELYKILNQNSKKKINLYIGKKNISIYIGKIIFISKLLEGKFPDYISVLLKKIKYKTTINANILKKSLLRASIFCHEKFNGVKIKIKNNVCNITANNQEEKIKEKIQTIENKKNFEITVNVYYLLDILSVFKEENISFSLFKKNSKMQILEKNHFLSIYIIMPINL